MGGGVVLCVGAVVLGGLGQRVGWPAWGAVGSAGAARGPGSVELGQVVAPHPPQAWSKAAASSLSQGQFSAMWTMGRRPVRTMTAATCSRQ